ncbi:cytochrome c [Nitratiruptor sp. YY09-18]|uniref:cytochrome c n=1 Tax=Nitratiruptor sp. YY09-18 TaxID=2724901 RepID=UPI0019154BAB|nr:cytochrome c [Nitratiruptor sp. YY09-18]BCD67914.1 hypothetical protein NitYY0918_C0821 [Nitratiruptor sp. YY09-18]
MLRIFFLLFPLFLLADSFITKDEYAKMLYQNPRGIGCHKCHGIEGRGMVIGKFKKDSNTTVVLRAPDITKLSYKKFQEALTASKHKLMPHYFLTKYEIKILYYYLKKRAK